MRRNQRVLNPERVNGAAVCRRRAGTDYAPATSGTSMLKGNNSGGFASATVGTDYAPATSGTSILKGNNAGGFSPATPGIDFYAPGQPVSTSDMPVANGGTYSSWSNFGPGSGTNTTPALTANEFRTQTVFIPMRQTFGRVGVRIGTGAAGTMRVALYNANCSVKLAETGTASTATSSTTAVATFAVPVTMDAGLYQLAWYFTGSPTVLGMASNTAVQNGDNDVFSGAGLVAFGTGTGADATGFPTSCGTSIGSAGHTPRFVVAAR